MVTLARKGMLLAKEYRVRICYVLKFHLVKI